MQTVNLSQSLFHHSTVGVGKEYLDGFSCDLI
ncbi:hypothetical protein Pr1d_36880 [Bythopirellula goksoeyrii]|uniref:Uncharacterized protein n=1 Tax=Bythopirellula goksoeyrii TaxID=1400387 RepID=A0A5B9QBJ4_9BACT|nr:hypothetical protein Pr1d_36880 [Bythopirellula goksoeyrii]